MKKLVKGLLVVAVLSIAGAFYIRSLPSTSEVLTQTRNIEYEILARNEVVPVSMDISFDKAVVGKKKVLGVNLDKTYGKYFEGTVDVKYNLSTAKVICDDENLVTIYVDTPQLIEHISHDEITIKKDNWLNEIDEVDAEMLYHEAKDEFVRIAKEEKDVYNVGLSSLASNTEEFLKTITETNYKVTVLYK